MSNESPEEPGSQLGGPRKQSWPRRSHWLVVFVFLVATAGGTVYLCREWAGHQSQPADIALSDALRKKMSRCVFQLKATFPDSSNSGVIQARYGTCVAVNPKGVFLTTAHTLTPRKSLQSVTVLVEDREEVATVVLTDPKHDMAVIMVKNYMGETIAFSKSEPKNGTSCFIFGFPMKYTGAVFPEVVGLTGSVESSDHVHERRDGQTMRTLLIRGTSHFGVSGGAAVDEEGRLLGMSFASRFPNGESGNPTHTLAIPLDTLVSILKLLPR